MADTRDSYIKQFLAGTFYRNCDIKKLRADGMTYTAIGSFYGLSKQRVHKIVTNPFNYNSSGEHPSEFYQQTPEQNLRGFWSRLRGLVTRLFHTDISIGG